MKSILIIGGSGYIGSRLRQALAQDYNIDSVDIGWYGVDPSTRNVDYHDLLNSDLEKYDVVILLAGHAGVKVCDGDLKGIWLNNVTNFTDLIAKLRQDQLVIYASSASVYGNSLTNKRHKEKITNFIPVNNYDLVKYTLDLQATIAILNGHNIIGLRFGTVNGYSPNLRVDVMINSMYESALKNKQIEITNKHINRALLGIDDLCRAISACIENPTAGIYNLASFNTTVEEIAHTVADRLNVPVVDNGTTENVYDFGLDCELFETTFNFEFKDTPGTIVDSLTAGYEKSTPVRRDQYFFYQWK
jgi:nucleoside-diphosphate-sugar epimerase